MDDRHYNRVPMGSARYHSEHHLTLEEQETLAFLLPLSEDYPHFEFWFRSRVIPGLRAGTRHIVRVQRGGTLIGIGIGKREDFEQKICTVRVAAPFFGRGFGLKVFDALLHWLGTDQPHFTISEKKLPAFQRIFDSYGFEQTSSQFGRYIPHVTEFAYNESKALTEFCKLK